MKVAPVGQRGKTEEKMKNGMQTEQYLVSGIHMFMYCLGLNPYKMNKENGELSFRWFSCETLWSVTRLIVFNSPFSFLPLVLFALFGIAEWEDQEWGQMGEVKNMTTPISNATSTPTLNATLNARLTAAPVYQVLFSVEYISCYSFFALSKVAKKYAQAKMLYHIIFTINKNVSSRKVRESELETLFNKWYDHF